MEQTYTFEAETEKLLELLTHSIYSKKEVFLRELISNSADAIEKAKLQAILDPQYLEERDTEFFIKLETNENEKTLTIEDNGIGMTQEEIKTNIGTIAKSGTSEFLKKIQESGEGSKDAFIGKFGVGFYSAFMVAKKVTIETKSAHAPGVYWESEGKNSFTIRESDKKERGTRITLYLKEEEQDFLKEWKIKDIIKKYSYYLPIPIYLKVKDEQTQKETYERINETKPIWTKKKQEIGEKEYQQLYESLSFDYQPYFSHIHVSTEGAVSYSAILFFPKEKPLFASYEDIRGEYGPKLFVKNILILEHAKEILPVWLRFMVGIVHTNDLPLNISREMLQANTMIEKMKKSLTKKIIDHLSSLLQEKRKEYESFYTNYSRYLKEGVYYEYEGKEKLASLLLFENTKQDPMITLDEYIEMFQASENTNHEPTETKEEKSPIYYIIASCKEEALSNPYIDSYLEKNIPVLIFTDPIDEWVIASVQTYQNHPFLPINQEHFQTKETNESIDQLNKQWKDMLSFFKNTIQDDRIKEVRYSDSIGNHIGALKTEKGAMTPHMEKLMKSLGQQVSQAKRILEINPHHPIIMWMQKEFQNNPQSETLKKLIEYIYEQALLLEGSELKDSKSFIQKINAFIENSLQNTTNSYK